MTRPTRLALDQPGNYEIKVQGRLAESWAGYFDEMQIAVEDVDGTPITTLNGPVADQTALRGLLEQLYTLQMVLLSVRRLAAPAAGRQRPNQAHHSTTRG